ncbi:hypothetical protein OCOJLMKI_3854 [Methylobacterium iners]|uniref:Uncharacterized protein n=1 Tax=Methylobacterium iners TaxID=418707 RepID=A0ABQ4S193_9HYPH|nr:hypothetical protein OCOJLMKI_3854 [Methylobacterium iners]
MIEKGLGNVEVAIPGLACSAAEVHVVEVDTQQWIEAAELFKERASDCKAGTGDRTNLAGRVYIARSGSRQINKDVPANVVYSEHHPAVLHCVIRIKQLCTDGTNVRQLG